MKPDELILFCDMDGTLLTDWNLGPYIPEPNLQAIRRFIAAGGLFSVATGRQYGETLGFFGDIRLSLPSVQGNGAVIYDSMADKVLKKVLLPEEVKLECLEYFLRHDEVWLVTADEHGIFQVASGDSARDDRLDDLLRRRMTIEEYLSFRAVKSCFVVREAQHLPQILREVKGFRSAGLFKIAQSSPYILELLEKSVDKAPAVQEVIALAGVQGRKLVCIGDYDNDLEMLALADFSACPANASDKVRALAQLQTCSNNEGAVADLLRQLAAL